VIIIRYRHILIRPSSLASPDNVNGLKRAVMLSDRKFAPATAKEAILGTIKKANIIKTIEITIRAATLKFMPSPFARIRMRWLKRVIAFCA
jgi:hypothetical protein